MLILFGSTNGHAHQLALLLQNIKKYNYNLEALYDIRQTYIDVDSILELNDFDFIKILDVKTLIFVVSTQKDGREPANMSIFWEKLKNKNLPDKCLLHLKFAVFGVGDSIYETFNFCAKRLHNCLIKLGGTPLLPLCCGDIRDNNGVMTEFSSWIQKLNSLLENELLENSRDFENLNKRKHSLVLKSRNSGSLINGLPSSANFYFENKNGTRLDKKVVYLTYKNVNAHLFLKHNSLDNKFLDDIISVYDINCVPSQHFFLLLHHYLCTTNLPLLITNKVKQIYTDHDLYCDYVTETSRTIFGVLIDFGIRINIDFVRKNFPKLRKQYVKFEKVKEDYVLYLSNKINYTFIKPESNLFFEYMMSFSVGETITIQEAEIIY